MVSTDLKKSPSFASLFAVMLAYSRRCSDSSRSLERRRNGLFSVHFCTNAPALNPLHGRHGGISEESPGFFACLQPPGRPRKTPNGNILHHGATRAGREALVTLATNKKYKQHAIE